MKRERIGALAREADAHMRVAAAATLIPYVSHPGHTIARVQDEITARAEAMPPGPQREQAQRAIAAARGLWWKIALSEPALAKAWARKLYPSGGQGQEDAEQAGNLALFEAARRFDPDRGVLFATHARWWVRALIGRVREGEPVVRLPRPVADARRAHHTHAAEGASVDESAVALGIDREDLRAALSSVGLSLDARMGGDGERSLHDALGVDPTEDMERTIDTGSALARLPVHLRAVAGLALAGLESREIAKQLGRSVFQVRAALRDAADILESHNGDHDAH